MTVDEVRRDWCVTCPARTYRLGSFDVLTRPKTDTYFDKAVRCRVLLETRAPVCVHPLRVGLPPGAYASRGEALPRLAQSWPRWGRRRWIRPGEEPRGSGWSALRSWWSDTLGKES